MKPLQSFIKKVVHSRYMIKSMVIRDIKVKYVGSFLGMLWSIIQPLTTLAVYYFVFSLVLKVKLETDNVNFAIWLMCGLLPWMMFAEITNRSSNILLDNKSLITKTNFNSEILPVVLILSGLVNHAIAMFLLFVVGMSLNLINITSHVVLLPLYVFFAIYFSLGLAWIISSLNVFIRDIGQLVGIVLNLWFYATPIVYPINAIPHKYDIILKLNPLYFIVEGYRGCILGYEDIDIFGLKYLLLSSTILFVLGGLIFKRLKRDFSDVI